MRFACTFPMLTHPANPSIVSGPGVARVAAALEEAGFDALGFTDHPAPSQSWLERGGHDALDPFVAMSFAAATTTTLRLMPNIVVMPYRNPFLVAKAGATLDLLSGGRFTLAVGAGYLQPEFRALGVDYGERNALFDEALEVIRSIWTEDAVAYEGRHFTATEVTAHPRPVTEPHPPIWIGGNAAAARQRVADHADGWCPFAAPAGLASYTGTIPMDTLDRLRDGIDDLARRLEANGRDLADVEVSFGNAAGGAPGSADFDAAAHMDGLAELGSLGVTWTPVTLPGDDLDHLLETIARYGEQIIAEVR